MRLFYVYVNNNLIYFNRGIILAPIYQQLLSLFPVC